ncbi:cbb3-type cytochrome oxidase subunit 3 [Alkalibacillus filiformis]|uniref:Cbb3-type cytochrome oxidase subunit 3 n=1 Tax=Alkalibacillus filiformis TaxID=200990 RepID=A0ABU0DUX8_9BACI|nr:cbb3-type cytochrome oxidase subunit 3 [Alkalibacillus filiformis]
MGFNLDMVLGLFVIPLFILFLGVLAYVHSSKKERDRT